MRAPLALDFVPAAGGKPARRGVVLAEASEPAQVQALKALRALLYAMNRVNLSRCQE
jgi:hypothetical protein